MEEIGYSIEDWKIQAANSVNRFIFDFLNCSERVVTHNLTHLRNKSNFNHWIKPGNWKSIGFKMGQLLEPHRIIGRDWCQWRFAYSPWITNLTIWATKFKQIDLVVE